MTTLSPTSTTLSTAAEEKVSYTNAALDAAEERALAGLKKGLEVVIGMQTEEARRRVQHEYGNSASTIQNAVLAIKKKVPEAERSPETVLAALRARYEESETSQRKFDTGAIKELTDRKAPAAEIEQLRERHATRAADRKLAMRCLAETLKFNSLWTAAANEVETALQAVGGRG